MTADAPPHVIACPDCPAVSSGPELRHDPSCPIGTGVDDVTASDAAWFEAHPDAGQRFRSITAAEVGEMRMAGNTAGDLVRWRVEVVRLGPGLRARRFVPPGGVG